MKDILILVATGFEDTELLTTANILNREGCSFDLASIENLSEVKGKLLATINTKKINEINTDDYKGIFIPGGTELIFEFDTVQKIIIKYNNENKIIAAICAAPEALKRAGILDGVKFTSFPGYATSSTNTGEELEISNNIITGRDYLATTSFAFALSKKIKSN